MRLMARIGRSAVHQRDSNAASWVRIRLVECTIRILAVAIVALIAAGQAGWLTRTAMLAPAAIGPLKGNAFQIPMSEAWSPSWFVSLFYPSDSMSEPAISSMQLTEGLRPLGPPHSFHQDIIEKGSGRFSNWNNWLVFSASDNSDPRTNGRAYSVADAPAASRIAAIPALLMLGLILVRLPMGRVSEMLEVAVAQKLMRNIARAWLAALYLASWGVAGAAAVYAGSIIHGLASGDALPTATVCFLWPITHGLHSIGLFLPWGILILAAIGAALGWVPGPLWRRALSKGEYRLIAFWGRAGIPVILLAFLFDMSGGGWSGQYLPTDINYMSNAGLVPYSDAQRYYGSAFDITYWGHWNGVASQRPFAAALRNLTVLLGSETYPGTLIAQSILVTIAIMFALRSVVAWRGFWAGLALFALLYGLVRPFLLTTLTEPLGFLWAVFSIGFFAESLRRQSLPFAMIGFAALTCALMTRMGSMFNIPFLTLWLPFAFARQWPLRLKIFAGTVGIALAIVAINGLLGWIYGAPGSDTGGNFYAVLCGLAHGTNWYECYNLMPAGSASVPLIHSVNQIFYAEAMRALRADPSVALRALWRNGYAFVYDLPAMLMEQYTRIGRVDRNYLNLGLLLMIPGWWCVVSQPRRWFLLSFAMVLFASSVLSSAVIFADDGPRTMIVTYAFVAFFVSLGFSAPGSFTQASPQPLSWRRSSLSLAAAVSVLLVIPAVQGLTARWAAEFSNPRAPPDVDLSIIPGRPVLSGFLVVPDGWGHGRDVPSLDLSTLTAMYRAIYTPYYGASTTDYLPEPPFAIIFAVPQNRKDLRQVFITPPELLSNNTAASHWRLQLDPEQSPPHGAPFIVVNKAIPIE
jgi:hypothetical protein